MAAIADALGKWSEAYDVTLKAPCFHALTLLTVLADDEYFLRQGNVHLQRLVKGVKKLDKRPYCLVRQCNNGGSPRP